MFDVLPASVQVRCRDLHAGETLIVYPGNPVFRDLPSFIQAAFWPMHRGEQMRVPHELAHERQARCVAVFEYYWFRRPKRGHPSALAATARHYKRSDRQVLRWFAEVEDRAKIVRKHCRDWVADLDEAEADAKAQGRERVVRESVKQAREEAADLLASLKRKRL
jgi:hypothetical protein